MAPTHTKLKSYEPRVVVAGSNHGRWSAGGRTVDDALSSGIEAWTYAFNGDYISQKNITAKDLANYDIAIINTKNPLSRLVRLAESRPQTLKWVSLIEGSADIYCVPQKHLQNLLNASDLVDVVNCHSLELFKQMTRTKVEYIGMPYPVDGVQKFMVPIQQRKRNVCICPRLLTRWNDFWVAKAVGLPYYGFERRHPLKGKQLIAELIKKGTISFDTQLYLKKAAMLYNDAQLEIRMSTLDSKHYFNENRDSLFWLDLDTRFTWARYVLDAAALSIPIIATQATHHSTLFFPQTTVAHAMQIDKAIEIGKRLAQDAEFYEHVALYPNDKMDFLKPGPMKQALLAALS